VTGPLPLSVMVLTHDEALNLPACLQSVEGLAGEIVVVDSGSTDATQDIARAAGATVVTHPFESHARQWRWALDSATLSHDWVLGLDADQYVTPELATELRGLFASGPPAGVDGFYVKRRQVFRGRWIRHGGYYPRYLLKLFRRDRVRLDTEEALDHHFYVDGPTPELQHDIVEHNRKEDDIRFWLQKHIRYADLVAAEMRSRATGAGTVVKAAPFGTRAQRSLWLRRQGYRLPAYWRAAGYFLYRYFFQLGFLDGREGFVFHFMQAFWFRVLVDVRLEDEARLTVPDRDATFAGSGQPKEKV